MADFFEPKIVYAREREESPNEFVLVLRMFNRKENKTTHVGGIGVLADLSFKPPMIPSQFFEMQTSMMINWISYAEIPDIAHFIQNDVRAAKLAASIKPKLTSP